MDDGNSGAERQFDHVSRTARTLSGPTVPERDHDVRGGDNGLSDLNVGAVSVGSLARQREILVRRFELPAKFFALAALVEIVAVDVRGERQQGADMKAMRSRAVGSQLVRAGRERRMQPDDRSLPVEQLLSFRVQAVNSIA